jgi:WD40 repeat protein
MNENSRDTRTELDAESGAPLRGLAGYRGPVHSVIYSPDGKSIVSASWDCKIRIWDAESGGLLHSINGHSAAVNSAVYSPDGKSIVSASRDCSIRIWDAESCGLHRTLVGHSGSVYSAVYSLDGSVIVSASRDGLVKIWSGINGAPLLTIAGHRSRVTFADYSPDGCFIATASIDRRVRVWSVKNAAPLLTIFADDDDVNSESRGRGSGRAGQSSDYGIVKTQESGRKGLTPGTVMSRLKKLAESLLKKAVGNERKTAPAYRGQGKNPLAGQGQGREAQVPAGALDSAGADAL